MNAAQNVLIIIVRYDPLIIFTPPRELLVILCGDFLSLTGYVFLSKLSLERGSNMAGKEYGSRAPSGTPYHF